MTPAQEAKEFAAAHGFIIRPVDRRYNITRADWTFVAEVGGYPAALNAMKRWVCDNVFPEGWKVVDTSVEEGEVRVSDAGAPTLIVTADALLNMPHVAIPTKTRAEIIEDMRVGLGLSPGVLEHVAAQESNGEWVDHAIVPTDAEIDALIKAAPVPIATGEVFDTPIYAQQYGRALRPLHLRGACQGVWTLDDGEFYKPNPGYPWRVWQKAHDGAWRALIPFATRADAVAYCRRLANIRSLHNLAREIRYEV